MQEQILEKDEEIKLFEAKSAALEKEIQWKKQVRNQKSLNEDAIASVYAYCMKQLWNSGNILHKKFVIVTASFLYLRFCPRALRLTAIRYL